MFKTTGIIKYSPKRSVNSDWWLTVELFGFVDTARYLTHQLDKNWWIGDSRPYKRKYFKPSHPYHVSIIRGEKPKSNLKDWGTYLNNKKITLSYSNLLRQTSMEKDNRDDIWFVDAYFDELPHLRKYFGLDWQSSGIPFKGHITICKTNS